MDSADRFLVKKMVSNSPGDPSILSKTGTRSQFKLRFPSESQPDNDIDSKIQQNNNKITKAISHHKSLSQPMRNFPLPSLGTLLTADSFSRQNHHSTTTPSQRQEKPIKLQLKKSEFSNKTPIRPSSPRSPDTHLSMVKNELKGIRQFFTQTGTKVMKSVEASPITAFNQEKTPMNLSLLEKKMLARMKLDRDRAQTQAKVLMRRDTSYIADSLTRPPSTTRPRNDMSRDFGRPLSCREVIKLQAPLALQQNEMESFYVATARRRSMHNISIAHSPFTERGFSRKDTPLLDNSGVDSPIPSNHYDEPKQVNTSKYEQGSFSVYPLNTSMQKWNEHFSKNFNTGDLDKVSPANYMIKKKMNIQKALSIVNSEDPLIPKLGSFSPFKTQRVFYSKRDDSEKEDDLITSLKRECPSTFSPMPPGRQDVLILSNWLQSKINEVNKSELDDAEKCTKCDEIYNLCLNELLRQVTLECTERGELLYKVWTSYYQIFLQFKSNIITDNEQRKAVHFKDLQQQNELFRTTYSQKNSEIEKLEQELKTLRHDSSKLQQKYEKLEAKDIKYKTKIDKLKKIISFAKVQIDTLKSENSYLTKREAKDQEKEKKRKEKEKNKKLEEMNQKTQGMQVNVKSPNGTNTKSILLPGEETPREQFLADVEAQGTIQISKQSETNVGNDADSEISSESESEFAFFDAETNMKQKYSFNALNNNLVAFRSGAGTSRGRIPTKLFDVEKEVAETQTYISLMPNKYDDVFENQRIIDELVQEREIKKEIDQFAETSEKLLAELEQDQKQLEMKLLEKWSVNELKSKLGNVNIPESVMNTLRHFTEQILAGHLNVQNLIPQGVEALSSIKPASPSTIKPASPSTIPVPSSSTTVPQNENPTAPRTETKLNILSAPKTEIKLENNPSIVKEIKESSQSVRVKTQSSQAKSRPGTQKSENPSLPTEPKDVALEAGINTRISQPKSKVSIPQIDGPVSRKKTEEVLIPDNPASTKVLEERLVSVKDDLDKLSEQVIEAEKEDEDFEDILAENNKKEAEGNEAAEKPITTPKLENEIEYPAHKDEVEIVESRSSKRTSSLKGFKRSFTMNLPENKELLPQAEVKVLTEVANQKSIGTQVLSDSSDEVGQEDVIPIRRESKKPTYYAEEEPVDIPNISRESQKKPTYYAEEGPTNMSNIRRESQKKPTYYAEEEHANISNIRRESRKRTTYFAEGSDDNSKKTISTFNEARRSKLNFVANIMEVKPDEIKNEILKDDEAFSGRAKLILLAKMYRVEKEKTKILTGDVDELKNQVSSEKEGNEKLKATVELLRAKVRRMEERKEKCIHNICPICGDNNLDNSGGSETEMYEGSENDEVNNLGEDDVQSPFANGDETKKGSLNVKSDELSDDEEEDGLAPERIKESKRKKSKKPASIHNVQHAPELGKKKQKEKIANPAMAIIATIKDSGMKKFKNFMPIKSVLKNISCLYNDRSKENANYRDEEFPNFVYLWFINNFGFKKIAEQKFIVFILSVKKYLYVVRINLFARFMGLLDGSSNYNLEEFTKYLEAIEYMSKLNLGFPIQNLETDAKHYIPYLKGADYVKYFAENKMTLEEYTEFKRSIEAVKEADPKHINRSGIVDFDLLMTKALAKYRILCNRTKQNVVNAFKAADLDGNKHCSLKEFITLYRNIEADKYDYWFAETVFNEHADVMVEGEMNLSFDKFTVVCVEYALFSDAQQDLFLGIQNKEELITQIQELKEKWTRISEGIKEDLKLMTQVSEEEVDYWLEILNAISERITTMEDFTSIEVKPLLIAYKIMLQEVGKLKEEDMDVDAYGVKRQKTKPESPEVNSRRPVEKIGSDGEDVHHSDEEDKSKRIKLLKRTGTTFM